MKILLDQNLSYKLVESLSAFFPSSNHVKNLHLEKSTDQEIWQYAKEKGYILITQDADFFEMSILYGFPPKVLWVRTGNTSTKNIESLLINHFRQIRNFIDDPNVGCLELL